MSAATATLEALLYQRGLRALDRTAHHGSEALAYEDALLRLALMLAANEAVTHEDVPGIEFKFENGQVTAHQPKRLLVMTLVPTNVDWRAMNNQSRVLYDERDRILAWFERKGYSTRGL